MVLCKLLKATKWKSFFRGGEETWNDNRCINNVAVFLTWPLHSDVMFANTQSKKRERETLGLDSIERSVKNFTLELFSSEAKRVIFKFFVYISKRDNSKVGKNVCLAWRNYEFVSVSLLLASLARRFIQIKTSEKKALMSWRGFV